MKTLTKKTAVNAINDYGMLLVFPMDNRPEPKSLWSVAYKDEMRWEWDDNGDDRVARLWHLRTELSLSGDVIYTKWYRDRATFFSKPVFTALLASFLQMPNLERSLSQNARGLLEAIEADSPISTKQLKEAAGLKGRSNEGPYGKALKELWNRCLIVAYGEVEEGAFPSLAMGATKVLFEDLYTEAASMSDAEAQKVLKVLFKRVPLAEKFYAKVRSSFEVKTKTKKERPKFVDFENL